MRRLYFLAPHINSAKAIFHDLLLARVDDHHVHVVSKDESELIKEDLPAATLFEKSDLVPSFERGLIVGFASGLVLSFVGVFMTPFDVQLGGASILAITLFGAFFGAWVSSMIGISLHNSHLKGFENAISKGEYLFIVDVPKSRMPEITKLMKRHHPEAGNEGSEPTMPAFP